MMGDSEFDDSSWGRREGTGEQAQKEPVWQPETRLKGVGIIGGGLAGLAAAIALTRAGVECRVYERAGALRSISQGCIAVWSNGLGALEEIHPELPELIRAAGTEILENHNQSIDAAGHCTSRITPLGEIHKKRFGRTSVMITWHNLQQSLASLLEPSIVTCGHDFHSYVEEDDSVLLRFQNGRQVRCDAALGCDGIFSRVWRQMHPSEKLVDFGQVTWNALVRRERLPPGSVKPNCVHTLRSLEEPAWSSFLLDAGSDLLYVQVRVSDSEKGLAMSGSGGRGGLGIPGSKAAMMSVAARDETVRAAVEAVDESQLFERCMMAHLPLPTWQSPGGRVALLGDSAHAMHPSPGQGANSSFEDVAALARAARDSAALLPGKEIGWPGILARYESERKTIVDMIQAMSNYDGAHQNGGAPPKLDGSKGLEMSAWAQKYPDKGPPVEGVMDIVGQFDVGKHHGVKLVDLGRPEE